MRPITATVTSILVATLICACMPCAQAQPPTDCQFGKMRFFWTHAYGCIVKEPYHQFPLAAGVTHMEIAGLPFTNPPDRKQYDRLADIMKQDIAFLHGHGVKVFGYHPGTFLYGYEDAPATRPKGETGPLKKWFDFFESRWEQQYSDYFGKRPATLTSDMTAATSTPPASGTARVPAIATTARQASESSSRALALRRKSPQYWASPMWIRSSRLWRRQMIMRHCG